MKTVWGEKEYETSEKYAFAISNPIERLISNQLVDKDTKKYVLFEGKWKCIYKHVEHSKQCLGGGVDFLTIFEFVMTILQEYLMSFFPQYMFRASLSPGRDRACRHCQISVFWTPS